MFESTLTIARKPYQNGLVAAGRVVQRYQGSPYFSLVMNDNK
jgi:hypothetical protein